MHDKVTVAEISRIASRESGDQSGWDEIRTKKKKEGVGAHGNAGNSLG